MIKKAVHHLFVLLFVTFSVQAQEKVTVYDTYDDFATNILIEDENIYVINFWATWCAPCIKELPYFEKLNAENKNVKVILVSLDSKKDLDKKLIPFIDKRKLKSKVLLLADKDYNSWLSKVDADWSGAIPATLLLNRKKKQFAERDFENFDELNQYVNSFINLK
ncbi:TlpA family protein disulfide reductase [Flavobacterium macrobrachii]|uniref:Redoxin domain-containing protein n=1 Tax=Flavobacterium macrobrachii TaxID=591204 RepID=A0ABS2CZL7_9FLAO|nr:TlpA disulfide reductase family protein [Flavobacterium macrobrachii]MBM6500351.1 redoxin domain-containing protein [Flavobacterium macrobrachii]PZO29776.1 MAG: thioredoxin [Flavobacteriaceae bacterium]